MARYRRRARRSTSQKIAGLVALGLPAPVQRVADSRIGSLLMLIFVPAMIISGILTVKWDNGTPSFSFDRKRAAEELKTISDKARGKPIGQVTEWFTKAAQEGGYIDENGGGFLGGSQTRPGTSSSDRSGSSGWQGWGNTPAQSQQPSSNQGYWQNAPSNTAPAQGFYDQSGYPAQPVYQSNGAQGGQYQGGQYYDNRSSVPASNNDPRYQNQGGYYQQAPTSGGWGQNNTAQGGYAQPNYQNSGYQNPGYSQTQYGQPNPGYSTPSNTGNAGNNNTAFQNPRTGGWHAVSPAANNGPRPGTAPSTSPSTGGRF